MDCLSTDNEPHDLNNDKLNEMVNQRLNDCSKFN